MAARITQEKIELINELYCEMGVKSHVAKAVGCSPASVTRYLIPGYVPKAQRREIKCDATIKGCRDFLTSLGEDFYTNFPSATSLTETEAAELEELRKEIF